MAGPMIVLFLVAWYFFTKRSLWPCLATMVVGAAVLVLNQDDYNFAVMRAAYLVLLSFILIGVVLHRDAFAGRIAKRRARKDYHAHSKARMSAHEPQGRAGHSESRAPPRDRERGPAIEEAVTVILRRQIPVRFDEPARSWLGGCPMMPEDIPWPTSPSAEFPNDGDAHLHFVAQIACADLPAELWGGLGPRTGWLLVFLDAQDPSIDSYPSTLQVIHIDRLGPERPPPEGTRPMRNEAYTGYGYEHFPSADDIPATWRRWPVDILTFPNELEREVPSEDPRHTVEDFSNHATAAAYGDAEINRRFHVMPYDEKDPVLRTVRYPRMADGWPFTWRGALYVVDSVIRIATSRTPVVMYQHDRERFEDPTWADTQIPLLRVAKEQDAGGVATYEKLMKEAAHSESREAARRRLEHWRDRLTNSVESLRLFEEHRDAEGLLALRARVEASMAAYDDWWRERLPELQAWRTSILAHDLDSALPAEEFRPLYEFLVNTQGGHLFVDSGSRTHGSVVRTSRTSLADWAFRGFQAALREVAADRYVESEEARALIPPALLDFYEPRWRFIDRPHRLGGWHDGIQSDSTGVPSDTVLLFQIASDYPMQWCWGDVGAYYVFIKGSDLEAGRFDRIEYQFENH